MKQAKAIQPEGWSSNHGRDGYKNEPAEGRDASFAPLPHWCTLTREGDRTRARAGGEGRGGEGRGRRGSGHAPTAAISHLTKGGRARARAVPVPVATFLISHATAQSKRAHPSLQRARGKGCPSPALPPPSFSSAQSHAHK